MQNMKKENFPELRLLLNFFAVKFYPCTEKIKEGPLK